MSTTSESETAAAGAARSKTVATWLALLGGSLGLHRFYLYGTSDAWAWLHPLPTAIGAYGFWRMRELGVDDRLGAMLVPLLGVMLASTMLVAIVYGLTPDERWNQHHGNGETAAKNGWANVIGVILALAVGAGITMATLAFVAQRYFESQTTALQVKSQRLTA